MKKDTVEPRPKITGPQVGNRSRTRKKAAKAEPGRRLSPEERERQIVEQAIEFFAEHGFKGQTRELAKEMGITQPLLYRYFPTKDALIERVYQEVFVGHWKQEWEDLIRRKDIPLRTRLRDFYIDYAKTILTYQWVRLFMFSGLRGLDFNTRYLNLVHDRIFKAVIEQLRLHYKGPSLSAVPMTPTESEIVWNLHASIYYLGVRQHIYRLPVPGDIDDAIATIVEVFLDGVSSSLAKAK